MNVISSDTPHCHFDRSAEHEVEKSKTNRSFDYGLRPTLKMTEKKNVKKQTI